MNSFGVQTKGAAGPEARQSPVALTACLQLTIAGRWRTGPGIGAPGKRGGVGPASLRRCGLPHQTGTRQGLNSIGCTSGARRIVCSFCAAMIRNAPLLAPALLTALLATLWGAPAAASGQDRRTQPFVIQSDNGGGAARSSATHAPDRQCGDFSRHAAVARRRAWTCASRPAASTKRWPAAPPASLRGFSQGRDVPGESVQGQADQVEFDTRATPCASSAMRWSRSCAARPWPRRSRRRGAL